MDRVSVPLVFGDGGGFTIERLSEQPCHRCRVPNACRFFISRAGRPHGGTEDGPAAFRSHVGMIMLTEVLMTRGSLIALVVVLAAGIGALAWQLHQERRQPDGVEISIGNHGVSIEKK